MPDTNFGNPFMANMSENPVHKIVVEVRNKAVPTRADVMQSKEGTFIAVPVEYDPNKDHAYKFAGPNQKKLLKEFGENFISVTQFGSIIEGIDDTSAINKINKILKSVGIEKTITGELKAVTEDMMDSVEKEVKRLSPEYGKEIENIFRRIKNFRVADTYGNAFHRAIELLEKEGSNDPRNIEKVLKRMAREKKADKTYGNVLSDVSDGDRSRNALLKDIDAYFKKKTELGLGNIAGAEQQLGAVVKIGNEIVKIAGTFDQLFLKTNYILRDLKTSSSKQPSPAYGLQLNLLEKLLNSVGISVSERGITRVKKGEAFDYKIGKISDQDITKLISMVLDIQKEKDPSNREALQVQARSILGSGAILTRVGKRGRQTTYNDMTLGDIQKYSYLTEDQKIDLVKNLFSGMSARDKDLFVSSLFNTNKYGKEGAVEPSNDFYRKGPFYDRLRKEIPNPYFGTASSDFGYKEFETKEGEKVGGSVYGGLFASQNAQKYRILKAKYGEAVANKFLDQMLRDIDSAIGSKTDDKTSYETAKSAESFFRSLGFVEDKTPLNQDFVKRIDELTSGYRNISEFLERERFGDLGGQLQGISKEEQALMARSSSDYRGIKETDQIFKTLASLREIGEGTGGLFDTIKKMEVDSKNIEDPKELLNKYSDILYSIFSGFSDFKDLISKSIKNLGRVSEIDEFGNYLEENKSEQILDYINDFYSNAENIIKNSQLTPEVQQNLISRLSYARSTEKNGSISHQIGYRVARGVGVYDYINSILAGGLEKANIAAQEKGMVELSPEQYAAFVLSPEAFSQYSLSKKFKENYQNKKNLPQFLRDFVSDSSYDESAEFASLKKQVAEEFINPTTRMFEDTRVYINEAGNVVSGLNVVSDILGKQLSDKSGEFNLAGEFKTLENEPEWANRILRGMGIYRIEDVDKKMESLPQFYGAVFPRVSDDRKNEIEKRKKELEEEKEKLDSLVGEHGAEYSSDEYEKIADEYEKIADETEKLNDELKTLTSAESSRENLLSQIKAYLDEQNNIYNQTIQTIEDNYKEVGNVSGTESHPEDFDTPEEKRDYFLKTAQENLLKRTGGLTSQMSDEELLNRLTSDNEIVLNKELSNLLRKYDESQGKVGTVSDYSAEQVEMVRNMMEVAKVGYEYQQKQLEEIKKAQEEAEKLQKENEEKVKKIKERAVNSKKAYETASVEITETEDFLKPDFVEDEEKTKRSVSAKRGWETRRKKQGNLLAPAPANVTTSPVQTAQSGPIHVIIDGTVQGDFKNKKTVMETWDADGNLISFSTKDISKRSGSPRGTPQLDVIKQIKEDTGNIVQMMASVVTVQNIQSPQMMSPGPGRAYRVKKTDDTEKQKLKNEREYQALLNKRLSILDSLLSAQKKAGITQGREKQSQLDIVEEEQKRLDDIEQRIGVASGKNMDPERKRDIEYLNSLAESTRKVKVAAKDRGNRTIFDVIKSDIQRATMRITDFGLAAKVLNTARKEIQQVYQNILKLDEVMTNLRIVTGSNTEQAKSMMNTYNDLAMQLGTTTQAVAQSAAEWLRQGYSVSEANELIKSSTYLSRLGFMDMNQSVTALTSVMKGFRIEATDSMDIVDKLTQLDAKYATTAGDIATALSRTSAVAREAGLDLNQTAAALTTMIDVSQQDASSVGNAFRTILARYGNVKATAFTSLVGDSDDVDDTNSSINDTEKVLGAIGIKIRSSSSDMRDFDDVMDELADKWVTLTDVEKNAVSTALAGVRQRNIFGIYMENYDTYKQAISEAEKAEGTAARKTQAYNESIAYSINQLSAAWEGFTQKLEASPAVKIFFTGLTAIIENLDHILQQLVPLIVTFNADKIVSLAKFLSPLVTTPLKAIRHPIDTVGKSKGAFYENMTQKMTAENTNAIEELTNATKDNTAALRGEKQKSGAGGVGHQSGTTGKGVRGKKGFNNIPTIPTDGTLSTSQYTPEQINLKVQSYDSAISDAKQNGTNEKVIKQLENKRERLLKIKSEMTSVIPYDPNIQKAAEEERAKLEAQKNAERKTRLNTGVVSGLAAGAVRFANKGSSAFDNLDIMGWSPFKGAADVEVSGGEAAAMGVAQTALTGALTAWLGPFGTIIGSVVGDLLSSLWKKIAHADEIARKERVEQAKENLEAIKGISTAVTGLIDLRKKGDTSLWDADDWKQANEYVESLEKARNSSVGFQDVLNDAVEGLGNYTLTIEKLTENQETLAKVEAARIKYEAEQTYAAGEQDRYTLLKEVEEAQKKLTSDDEDERKQAQALIKANKAAIQEYSDELNKAYMKSAFYSSGVSTMSQAQKNTASLERLIVEMAEEAEKAAEGKTDEKFFEDDGTLKSEYRSKFIQQIREQGGYEAVLTESEKSVADYKKAMNTVTNITDKTGNKLNMKLSDLKKLVSSKGGIAELGDMLGKTGEQLNKIVDQINSADDSKIATIAHSLNMTVEEFSEANKNGDFDFFTTGMAVENLDAFIDRIDKLNGYLAELATNGKLSAESLENVVKNYAFLMQGANGSFGAENILDNLAELYAEGSESTIAQALAGKFQKKAVTDETWWNAWTQSVHGKEFIERDSLNTTFTSFSDAMTSMTEEEKQSYIEYVKSLFTTDLGEEIQEKRIEWQTKAYETEISNLESIRDSLDDINKQREKELELIKAKEALENASKEKKRVYRAGVGFIYTTDQEAVKSAQDKVDELERQQNKDNIQYQIDSLQQQKEILENLENNKQLENLTTFVEKIQKALGEDGSNLFNSILTEKGEFRTNMVETIADGIIRSAAKVKEQENLEATKEAAKEYVKAGQEYDEFMSENGEILKDQNNPAYASIYEEYQKKLGALEDARSRYNEATKLQPLKGTYSNKEEYDETGKVDGFDSDKINRWNETGDESSGEKVGSQVNVFDDSFDWNTVGEAAAGAAAGGLTVGGPGYAAGAGLIAAGAGAASQLGKAITGADVYMSEESPEAIGESFTKHMVGKNRSEKDRYVIGHYDSKDKKWIFESWYGDINDAKEKMQPYDILINDWNNAFYKDRAVFMDSNKKFRWVNADEGVLYANNWEEALDVRAGSSGGKFASGTLSAPGGRSMINENGLESIITPSGTITSLPAKSGIIPADLTRNLWALGEVAPNLIARLGGNSLQTNNSNSSTDNSINIQNLDATFNTQSDFDGHRFLTDLRNQVILTANNH